MSPQILSRNFYTFKCDVWSLGIIIYELYFDHLPWKAQDLDGLFFQILNNPQPYLDKLSGTPKIIERLLLHTLMYLEKDRLNWDQLIYLLNKYKKGELENFNIKQTEKLKKKPSFFDN